MKPKTGKLKGNWFNGANGFEEDEDDDDDILDFLDGVEAKFPDFFPPELLSLMSAAQKSLVPGSAKSRATRPCNVNQ